MPLVGERFDTRPWPVNSLAVERPYLGNFSSMTINWKRAERLPKEPDVWQLAGFSRKGRKANLPKGFRLYSNADWVRDIRGLPMPPTPEELEFERLYWMLDLDAEPPAGSRYMSLTQRVRRYWEIDGAFKDIKFGIRAPKVCVPLPHGTPVFLPNHGPAAEWVNDARAVWVKLPANDSEIFKRLAETESPKNSRLAEKLAPLLQWARMLKPLALDSTNWLQADNDNYFDGDEPAPKPASNRERRIRPGSSYQELRSYIAKAGPLTTMKHPRLGGGGAWETIPADPAYPARAGKLHIANGKTETAGKRVEAGTVLYQPDSFRELLGPEPDKDDVDMTRAWAARVYGRPRTIDGKPAESLTMEVSEREIDGRPFMVPRPFKPAGRIRRKVRLTREDQVALLATAPRPPVTYCPPGLPNGSADVRGIFAGAEIMATKGKSGVELWEDVSDELARQAEFERWAKALPPEQARAMNLACAAANFREIGSAFGKKGKPAERHGKKILLAANSNSKKILAA